MSDAVSILTPVGRLVAGDPFRGQDKDADGNPLVIKTGPNAGQPRVDYFMAVAVPKTDPTVEALRAEIAGVGRRDFPHLFDASGNCINPQFAFKITDGDSQIPNSRNIRPCDREGYPGCWVFNFSSGFAPECYSKGGAERLTDPNAVKRGYYVRIYGSVVGNGSQQRPGVYLNHSMLELVGYGDEINTGPDGAQVFGGQPAGALPPGASEAPLAGAPIAQPAQTMPPAGAAPAAAVGAPGAAPGAADAAGPPPPPATDFLNPPPAAAAAELMRQTPDGRTWTAAQLTAAGYTAAQIEALPAV